MVGPNRKAIDIFNEWAVLDKDFGMEKNHSEAVRVMLDTMLSIKSKQFTFIDAGCGNGWVVRKMRKNPLCKRSLGIDGALEMIRKAKTIDPMGEYIYADLMHWKPEEKMDIVHSMEVIYYFKKPEKLLRHIRNKWLKPNGRIIVGLDYYYENKNSHTWPVDLNTQMTLLRIKEWVELFQRCKFHNVEAFQTNSSDNFPGTLVINGTNNI